MKKFFSAGLKIFVLDLCFTFLTGSLVRAQISERQTENISRQRISINEGWRFFKYDSLKDADKLIYDERPEVSSYVENKVADLKPTEAAKVEVSEEVLKPWILPSSNNFIKDPQNRHIRPDGNPGSNFQFVRNNFDDSSWENVNLPHDWAINGPFMTGVKPEVGGGMGRLPVNGVAWYRKKLDIPASDAGKSVFLDVDGAMSYAMVWLNGNLVGGWPYGYNSWRLDLTPYMVPGGENQLAIRLDNPNNSSRWYPGGGIYRNVWLTKTSPIHVAQWGAYITTKDVSKTAATINLEVTIDNNSKTNVSVEVINNIYTLDASGRRKGNAVGSFAKLYSNIVPGGTSKVSGSASIKTPRLWGPPPTQSPNLYVAVSTLLLNGRIIDEYETRFGIRSVIFDPDKGIIVNGEQIPVRGVNQHHDLGALGAAFNTRAAERQLEILREMGCNAIRMSHNPPAPELLELTDRMGFLVFNEIFDSWEQKKTPLDFHLIFNDWFEPDTRAFIRRDRNSPSVIIWSFGNEVGEQYTGDEGALIAKRLYDIIKEEDPFRPLTSAMNYAKPEMALPKVLDLISLNYQGEGIRQAPEFEGTDRIRTAPQYDAFHIQFPDKVILSSETASAFSSRGIYFFPVSKEISAPVRDGRGGDSKNYQVSSYELHAVDFGSSAEKVFSLIEQHPFVAGEFVWTGWDHLGEPTPYYEARSTYCGIIDLAGFKKDRFFLYQSHWRPDLPMVHILPHWNWPERIGEVTPVHVFTSGDEAELFLNGKSQGRRKKGLYEYRLRWDSINYEPGELKLVTYKNGKKWAEDKVRTTGKPLNLIASADNDTINSDGNDLAFITLQISDKDGLAVPLSNNPIEFNIEGPGVIVATDNGDPTNMVAFSSKKREAFNGLCLVVVRSVAGTPGTITVSAKSPGLKDAQVSVHSVFSSLNTLEYDKSPVEVGKIVTADLLSRPEFMMYSTPGVNAVHYAEACAGFGAIKLAAFLKDNETLEKLAARYDRVTDEKLPNTANHVDANVYGILPLELFIYNKEEKYFRQGIELADGQWLNPLPGGLTSQTRYWIDDIYMIGCLQVQAFKATGKIIYLERAALEIDSYIQKLQQPNGLFFHGVDAPFFWGRGNGWVAAGLAELLSVLPENNKHYNSILNGYKKMMKTLVDCQAEDGMWRQLIDKEESFKETSSTAMFGFSITVGVKKGLLPGESYQKAYVKAWNALTTYINSDGKVHEVCVGTGQSRDINFYLTRPRITGDLHGQAPILWFAYSLLADYNK